MQAPLKTRTELEQWLAAPHTANELPASMTPGQIQYLNWARDNRVANPFIDTVLLPAAPMKADAAVAGKPA
ncbi:hypothetical protein [Massilia sp. NR 4-1]|uniref:hypothetical protein n=1 Tax=Massilia sp. NR 4-1 TaxID=1678028 RepID=UPI001237960B|nr:hypothetical protein [Massilia sp. NR 4-1]